jgi:DNA-directed RNA polymerase specialized sigma54-like protein
MTSIPATIAIIPAKDAFLRNGLTAALPRMTEAQVRAALEYAQAAYPRVGDAYARMEADYICPDAVIAAAITTLQAALEGFAPVRNYNHRPINARRFI